MIDSSATCKNCRHSAADVQYTRWEKSGYLVCLQPKWVKGYYVEQEELSPDGVHVENDEDWGLPCGSRLWLRSF